MTDTVITSIITGTVSLISLAMTLLIRSKVTTIVGKVDSYHREVDGKMSLLLTATAAQKKAEGVVEGKEAGVELGFAQGKLEGKAENRTEKKEDEEKLK